MTRLLTAAILIPIVLFGIFSGHSWVLLAVIEGFAILTWMEYAAVTRLEPVARGLGLLIGIGLIAMPLDWSTQAIFLFAALSTIVIFLSADLGRGTTNTTVMFFGVFYVFGAMKTGYLLGLKSPWLLLAALALNWVGDSGAYYVGRSWGRHKLAPGISPGKTMEGAAASLLLATLFAAILMPRTLPMTIGMAAVLGIIGNVTGQLGDLAESALKRGAGVKDSGTLLPGHGGMLDRIDSALFTLPAIYVSTNWLRI